MEWLAYMEHLKSIFKEFNNIAASTNDLWFWYFWDDLRPSIYAEFDEQNAI